jgi:hypothetical protein
MRNQVQLCNNLAIHALRLDWIWAITKAIAVLTHDIKGGGSDPLTNRATGTDLLEAKLLFTLDCHPMTQSEYLLNSTSSSMDKKEQLMKITSILRMESPSPCM